MGDIVTIEDARKYQYGGGVWPGKYREGYCCFEVFTGDRGDRGHQCGRKAVCGPGNLYCKTHDPARVAAKRAAQYREWEEGWRASRERDEFESAAKAVCAGVPTAKLHELGDGWLARHLATEEA